MIHFKWQCCLPVKEAWRLSLCQDFSCAMRQGDVAKEANRTYSHHSHYSVSKTAVLPYFLLRTWQDFLKNPS